MNLKSSILRQILALFFSYLFFAKVYGAWSEQPAEYGVFQRSVELFLLVIIFYALFFVGKVFSFHWRSVDPTPKMFEIFLIFLFENVYLVVVSLTLPILIEGFVLNFNMDYSGVGVGAQGIMLLCMVVLFDVSGSIRNHVLYNNEKIRGRSLLKASDVLYGNKKNMTGSHWFIFILFILV